MSREDEVSTRAWNRRDKLVALLLGVVTFLAVLLTAGSTQPARAETVPELRGRMLLLTASFCGTEKDAELLAAVIAQGGEHAGYEFMEDPSNTCSVTELTVEVGGVIKTFQHRKRQWWISQVRWFVGRGKTNTLFLVAPTISLGTLSIRFKT
jgi:hypothetical protein